MTDNIQGATAPILTYGALNAILYTTYNRSLMILEPGIEDDSVSSITPFWKIWTAGAVGGMATWIISTPTELIKCQAQLQEGRSSWNVAKDIWSSRGIAGLYHGGAITSIRDAVGYGFYFWSYEAAKKGLKYDSEADDAALKILVAGGIAGVVTWTSIYPLDVIKTKIQSPASLHNTESSPLIHNINRGAWSIAKISYRQGGFRVFFRGWGICSIRAFIVNAVQVSVIPVFYLSI